MNRAWYYAKKLATGKRFGVIVNERILEKNYLRLLSVATLLSSFFFFKKKT